MYPFPSPYFKPILSDPICAAKIDFQTLQSHVLRESFEVKVTQDGFINAFCAYFKAHLDDKVVLTNSPWAPPTHWTQLVFQFPNRRPVKAGEVIPMEMVYEGGLTLWFKDEWE